VTAFLHSLGLPEVVAGVMVLALNGYVLTGGADFGGGLWDLTARGPRGERQRALIVESLAPIWEANHVWLIVVVVLLFTAFPVAFSTLTIVLHVPVALMLLGVVCRGSAFIFRSYGPRTRAHQRGWGAAFAGASIVTPVLLGVVIGALSAGSVGDAAQRIGTAPFVDVFIRPWVAWYPAAVGLLALALFAFLAATYLCVEADDAELREDFRKRALGAAVAVFLFAAAALAVAFRGAPRMATGLVLAPWALALHVATGVAAVTAFVALWRRKFRLARVAAAAQVSFILWGWVAAQYPFIVPATLTIRHAAAPPITLTLLLVGVAAGAAILIPSLRYLFRVFGDRRKFVA
jgi:cytochrome d ubiquinol oxidase subunit II